MSFNIKGIYYFKIPIVNMFNNTYIYLKGENLITLLGQSFFLNRCINEEYNTIKYICIGNGTSIPQKTDSKLSNETNRCTVTTNVSDDYRKLILSTKFKTEDIKGVSEIGVLATNKDNVEVLISHDIFTETPLNDSLFADTIGDVEIEYVFYFSTSNLRSGWKQHTTYTNVYWVYEPNTVLSVFDNTTNNGLRSVSDLPSLDNTRNAYWYDATKTQNLYIHLYHETNQDSPNPNTHEVLIQNK